MPGKIKVRILGARHLPVMDRSSENTDAFAEVKFGDYPPQKTEVCRKSLNPVWNSEVFKFEVADDLELQDEPLQIRIMDYDTYSANDAIGKVYIDLNPLMLMNKNQVISSEDITGSAPHIQSHIAFTKPHNNMMSGWLPIYDTLQGIRGEVNVVVKVELFSDFNKFRQSSCGVQFFCSADIPYGFKAKTINGFVEELVVNDDPEYQWIDKIRTPRASNEVRQSLFMKLSGAVQRKIGLKAQELGANAVVGYQQKFDVEGDTGIVVRGIGTAVNLVKSDSFGFNFSHKELTNKEVSAPKQRTSVLKAYSEFCNKTFSPPKFSKPLSSFLNIGTSEEDFNKINQGVKEQSCSSLTSKSIRSISLAALSPVLRDFDSTESFSFEEQGQFLQVSMKSSHKRVSSCDMKIKTEEFQVLDLRSPKDDKSTAAVGSISESSGVESDQTKLVSFAMDRSRSPDVIAKKPMFQFESFQDSISSSSDENFLPQDKKSRPPQVQVLPATPITERSYGDSSGGGSITAQEQHLQSLEIQMMPSNMESCGPSSSSATTGGIAIRQTQSQPISALAPVQDDYSDAPKSPDPGLDSDIAKIGGRNTPDSETGSPKAFASSWTNDRIGQYMSSQHVRVASRPAVPSELLEYPFITLKKFPSGFLQRIGGLVSCRSVKLLDGLEEDEETRDAWWIEIRQEIRSHAKCLGCNVVVGYSEDTAIWDDIVVLCASGTAAVADLHLMLDLEGGSMFGPPFFNSADKSQQDTQGRDQDQTGSKKGTDCSYVHIPYMDFSLPYMCKTAKCALCSKGRVPDIMFSTIEPPSNYDITGRGCLVQAKVLRLKKDLKGENNAKEISDALPFLEYETHRQFVNKLKVMGMNALFGLKSKISMSDRALIATATATACFLTALPVPKQPKLMSSSAWQNDPQYLNRIQKKLEEKISENEKYYGLQQVRRERLPDSETEDGTAEEIRSNGAGVDEQDDVEDFFTGHKDMCVLEIDDSEDVDILDSMMDPFPPPLIQVLSTEETIGIPQGLAVNCCQTFSQVWRGKIHPSSRDLSTACQRVLAGIYFKLRRLRPCILTRVNFLADIDEENELQICVYGSAIALSSGGSNSKTFNSLNEESACNVSEKGDPEREEAGIVIPPLQSKVSSPSSPNPLQTLKFYSDGKSVSAGINLTPMSYIPGAKIEHYLGNLNIFLIRETSSLREVGGLNTFVQLFVSEVFSIVRSHVYALGGNGLVAFFMSEFMVTHSQHKNQCQCILHVGGDVVSVSYVTAPTEIKSS